MTDRIDAIIKESIRVHEMLTGIAGRIREAADMMSAAIARGNKILFAGNGGSAADAQHLAAELVNRFQVERRPIAGLALTTDTSIITAIGNDYTFDDIFAKQIMALGNEGDIFLGISTSGNSRNIIRAIDAARDMDIRTVGLTGQGGAIRERVDCAVCIPSDKTPRIQEAHILVGHIICEIIEEKAAQHI